jgi:HME family heavy-metal exporter
LTRVFDNPKPVYIGIGCAVFFAASLVPTLPRAFLPPFNEGSLLVELILEPGISLENSARIGQVGEKLMLEVPEVQSVGRRTGRAESDEHALGVHANEYEVLVKLDDRRMSTVMREVRSRLAGLPGDVAVGQPMSHRLIDHVLTGTTSQVVVKIFGDDLTVLRTLAQGVKNQLSGVAGIVDLQVEKLVPVPQIQIRIDPDKAELYGAQSGELTRQLAHMTNGVELSQIIDGIRYFDVVMRLADPSRDLRSLSNMLIDTPSGRIPLSYVATVEESNGPNEVQRENGRRRILVTANGDGSNDKQLATEVSTLLTKLSLPTGYFATFEGIYAEQLRSSLRLLGLSLVSLALIFAVLYTRYRSVILTMIIMTNVPLALIGSVLALKLTGLELSVASMVGFITLTGISTRNGILKISHYINLVLHEGEQFGREMVIRGSQERLVPVLMTATSACCGLLPLVIQPYTPGKEILFPVAVTIMGGLVSATLLDALLTPLLFLRFGRGALARLMIRARGDRVVDSY